MRRSRPVGAMARPRLALLLAMATLAACLAQGLSLGNISYGQGVLAFTLANDSERSGDVAFWVEQADLITCERLVRIRARATLTLTTACGNVQDGRFLVRALWSDMACDRALVAQRITRTD